MSAWAAAAVLAGLFFDIYTSAELTGHRRTDVPERVYRDLIPRADEFSTSVNQQRNPHSY